jgi:hypothetical protein
VTVIEGWRVGKELEWVCEALLMRVRECPECERLWDKYTDAAFAFMRLNAQAKMAQLQQELPEVMALLKEGVEAAAHRRDAAQKHLKQHEATHKTRSAAAS